MRRPAHEQILHRAGSGRDVERGAASACRAHVACMTMQLQAGPCLHETVGMHTEKCLNRRVMVHSNLGSGSNDCAGRRTAACALSERILRACHTVWGRGAGVGWGCMKQKSFLMREKRMAVMAHGTTESSVTERSSAATSGGASECETSSEYSTTTHRVLLAPSTRPAVTLVGSSKRGHEKVKTRPRKLQCFKAQRKPTDLTLNG
jgi:hypothetical protein